MKKIFSIASRMYGGKKPIRDKAYLVFVRSFPCVVCLNGRVWREAMHIGPHGLGQKASDLDTLPGCRKCHQELHRLGPMRFQLLHGISFPDLIAIFHDMYTKRYGRLPGEERRAA